MKGRPDLIEKLIVAKLLFVTRRFYFCVPELGHDFLT
jgi:hypothetical protein